MPQDFGGISIDGLQDLMRNFDAFDKAATEAALVGLETAAVNIIADAKENLKNNGSVVTSLLRNSGRTERNNDEVIAGFFDTKNKQGYAYYVEFGRRAGKMPPPDELAEYAYKKFHLTDRKLARAMGWGMAKNIAKYGTTPHPFFVPAINKNTKTGGMLGGVTGSVAESIRKLIRKTTANFALEARRIKNTPVSQ